MAEGAEPQSPIVDLTEPSDSQRPADSEEAASSHSPRSIVVVPFRPDRILRTNPVASPASRPEERGPRPTRPTPAERVTGRGPLGPLLEPSASGVAAPAPQSRVANPAPPPASSRPLAPSAAQGDDSARTSPLGDWPPPEGAPVSAAPLPAALNTMAPPRGGD